MKFGKHACWWGSLGCAVAALGLLSRGLAVEPAAKPDALDAVPIADLDLPIQNLLNDANEILTDKSVKFNEDTQARLKQIGNTLAVLVAGLDIHEAAHPTMKVYPGMVEAALALAGAADLDEANASLALAKSAWNGNGQGVVHSRWEKFGELGPVMKGVGGSFTALGRNVKGARLKSAAAKTEGFSASLAVIGQATLYHTEAVKDSKDMDLWKQYAGEMRDSAAAVNGAIHAADAEKTAAAMTRLNTSCEACHKHFKPEVKGKTP